MIGPTYWLIFLSLWYVAQPAYAQYRSTVWTAANGLPQNVIRGIEQTPDGYLWIATLDGIVRFDGVSFTIFNKSNTAALRSNRFASIFKDGSGDLWLVTEVGGVTRYHKGQFFTYGAAQGVRGNIALGLTGDQNGNVWVLTLEGIERWDERLAKFTRIANDRPVLYKPFEWGENVGFWAADGNYLQCFVRGHIVRFHLPSWLKGNTIWNIVSEQSGTLLLERLDGEHIRVDAKGIFSHPLGPMLDSVYVDGRGHSWTVRVTYRLVRSLLFTVGGRAEFLDFRSIGEDAEHNLWVGSQGKGLFRFQPQSIRAYSVEEGLNDRNVYPIFQDGSGAIWIGAWMTGISRYYGGRFTHYRLSNVQNGQLATSILQDRNGLLWVGTHGGLRVLEGGVFRPALKPNLPYDAQVQAISQDHDGRLWFGTSKGLVRYVEGRSTLFTTSDGLATDDIRVIEEDAKGDLWIGGYGGLTHLGSGKVESWKEADGLPSNNVRAIHIDEKGVVWIGTYDGGLGRLEQGRLLRITAKEGLFNNGVFQILDDGLGYFWMSSNRGIYRVKKQELRDFAAGRIQGVHSVSYGEADGMLNVECNGGYSPAGIRANDGTLWFPTQDGVAVVDPKTVQNNPNPPPVLIEAAIVDRKQQDLQQALVIRPGQTDLELHYTALSFVKSDQIDFKYMLEGLDAGWTDAGSRRVAYYSHLPHGSYKFHVIAANSDGVWNMQGRVLALQVIAPFYDTFWFRTAIALLFCSVGFAAWKYRVRGLERAHAVQQVFARKLIASQEGERKRIAGELHDGLGQRLVVIRNLAALLLRSHLQPEDVDATTLKEISEEAAHAIAETREISHNLRPFQLDRLGLTKAVGALLRSASAASGIQFQKDIDDIDDLAPEELRINLYRIVQESLNNIVKHSEAKSARLVIRRSPARLSVTVEDDGRGFSTVVQTMGSDNSGFGLTGMAERATLLGGNFVARSQSGKGTILTIELPLKDSRL